MLIQELILEARRVLGDTAATGWTDGRMIDIANRGMRDIARQANMYRKEHILELTQGRSRYPLPTDLLKITSIYLANNPLPIVSKLDRPKEQYANKDQINLGVLEIYPIINTPREPMFFDGRVDVNATLSNPNGVAATPTQSVFGVTASITVPFDKSNRQPYGTITGIAKKSGDLLVHYDATNNNYGVLASIAMPTAALTTGGGVAEHKDTSRLIGAYGIPGDCIRLKNRVHIYYKSLPPKIQTIHQAFPLSPQWEDLMVDWIIGTALADDNDASNQQRSVVFLQRYTRNMKEAIGDSAVDYTEGNRTVQYNGGIVDRKKKRR